MVIGIGGLGHIALQCLRELSSAEVIAVDTAEESLRLAEALGADGLIRGGEGAADRVEEASGGDGVEAVLDFVGEHGTTEQGPAMLRQGGTYFRDRLRRAGGDTGPDIHLSRDQCGGEPWSATARSSAS